MRSENTEYMNQAARKEFSTYLERAVGKDETLKSF